MHSQHHHSVIISTVIFLSYYFQSYEFFIHFIRFLLSLVHSFILLSIIRILYYFYKILFFNMNSQSFHIISFFHIRSFFHIYYLSGNDVKFYFGPNEMPWKFRFYYNRMTLGNIKYKNNRGLSKYFWQLKHDGISHHQSTGIL